MKHSKTGALPPGTPPSNPTRVSASNVTRLESYRPAPFDKRLYAAQRAYIADQNDWTLFDLKRQAMALWYFDYFRAEVSAARPP